TANTETILITARGLLAIATPMIERRGITLVGVAVSNLEDGLACQLALAIDRHSSDALDAAIDEVRQRFGSTAVTRAVLLGRSQPSHLHRHHCLPNPETSRPVARARRVRRL